MGEKERVREGGKRKRKRKRERIRVSKILYVINGSFRV